MPESGPLFVFKFPLRTLFLAFTAACLLAGLVSLMANAASFAALEIVFFLSNFAFAAYAVGLATRNAPQSLGRLILCHLAIAAFLLVGPILAYHINGRAWYDYGLSPWNPPLSHFSDGRIGISDYDPKYTPPATWPVVGPVFELMCVLSVGVMIVPPTALIVCVALFVSNFRIRKALSPNQAQFVWLAWAAGSVPIAYLILWGNHVFGWIID